MDGKKENAKQNRDKSLDAVKGFAILVVMLGHCIGLNGLADPYLYDAIAAVQMPLFMAVSGYIAGLHVFEPTQRPELKSRAVTFGKRSIAYLVPFFTWMIFVSFPHCLTELKTELFHLDYGLWFLATLWIITLVTTLAAYMADLTQYTVLARYSDPEAMRKASWLRLLVYCLIVFVCYFGFFLQGRSGNTFLSPSLTVRYMPFYVAAYLVSYKLKVEKVKCESKKTVLWGLYIVCLIGFVYLVSRYDMIKAENAQMVMLQMTASFLGAFVCFYGVAQIPEGRLQRALSFIGRYTLEIYVLHFRFARLLKLEERNLEPFHTDTVLWLLAAFILMSGLTAASVFILKRFVITDFLCFGKIRPHKRKQIKPEAKMP